LADNKEVKNKLNHYLARRSSKRTEYFASCTDGFLHDFYKAALANDKLGTIVAAARLAQLGAALSGEYQGVVADLVASPTEQRVAQQQCTMVVQMLNANAEQCMLIVDEDSPVSGDLTCN